jgi:hypothetical protein
MTVVPTCTQPIDEFFIAWPFLGSRRMTATLRAKNANGNRWNHIVDRF